MSAAAGSVAIGVDIGGTFTDVVCRDAGGGLRFLKVPTTRRDPSAGVADALAVIAQRWDVAPAAIARFVHGTTVATNAVLEAKGARIGLITTEGFRDVLEIGRQMRHAMYDLVLKPETPVFLARGGFRKEVPERVAADGSVLVPLDEAAAAAAVEELVADGVEAIAVCLLFSFVNPAHERRVRDIIHRRHPDLMVSLSCEVDPAFREYERTCATAFDAYIKPVVARYLERLERDLAACGVPAPLQIMQSRGGIASSSVARQRPVRLFLSGPAAGVVGAVEVGRALGIDDLITVDIGGTSCDIALVSGSAPLSRSEGTIGGFSVRVPMVDVSTIGAGGGSIAWLDGAGTLRVGPQSAGSDPGPACYDRGGSAPTVTDASVILGYIDPERFADGSLPLVPQRARACLEQAIARPLGLSVEAAALGIHRILNAQMAEAIRLVSIGRGIDPRGHALLPLGGAGALHATALAGELGVRRIIVPPHPGVLSAAGLLSAPIEHEMSAAFARALDTLSWNEALIALGRLDAACAALMRGEGVPAERVEIRHFADVCYVGQSYHLEIPLAPAADDPLATLYRDFLAAHDRIYGHSSEGPARIVNLRAVHRSEAGAGAGTGAAPTPKGAGRNRERTLLTAEGPVVAAVHDRRTLGEGAEIRGPAIVEQADTTILIEAGWRGVVGRGGALLLARV